MVELAPHQIKALGELKNGSILKGGVGTGKSRTALAYYLLHVAKGSVPINGKGKLFEPTRPRDIYVITTAKKREDLDWEAEAIKFRISTDPDLSFGGVKIVIDSWNNIAKYVEVKDAFFIFDEQRLVGSGSWVKSFLKIAKSNRWILLSATPGDNWMDYLAVFLAHGFYKNKTEFVRRHVVYSRYARYPKIEGYLEQGHLMRLRQAVVVDMPYYRQTVRHSKYVFVDFDKEKFNRIFKDRWNIYEDQPVKDIAELFRLMRRLVNSDPSRLGAVMEILEKHPRLIIFYNFNYELESLRTLGRTLGIETKEWNGHRHDDLPEGDKWIYLVQYTAGAEGWECTTTDASLFFSLNYSYKITEQAKGRIDRMNTPYVDLFYYILRSNSAIDNAIIKALATKKTFNERDYFKGGF